MKKVLGILGLTLLLAALLAASVPDARALAHSHAQSMGSVDLFPGEDVTITCAGDQIIIRPIDPTQVRIDCKGSGNPAPTDTPAPTMVMPTDTPVPADTDTPVPDATLTPTLQATDTPAPTIPPPQLPTNTPIAQGPIAPYAGAPLCATHDNNAWHSLWDSTRGCHYNHTHNTDPRAGDAVFGPWAVLWGGQELSYPWATSGAENGMKHGGYKFTYREFPTCSSTNQYNGQPANCVSHARVEYHAVSGLMDYLARYHSFYEELRICKRTAPNQCGVIRSGGWADFGPLHVPYKQQLVIRPGGTVDFGAGMVMTFPADPPYFGGQDLSLEPYLAVGSVAGLNILRNKNPDSGVDVGRVDVWSMPEGKTSYDAVKPHPLVRFLVGVADPWNVMDPANPNSLIWVCTDAPKHNGCGYNGSLSAVNELSAYIPPSLDPDKDGFADYAGWTDRYGKIVTNCNAPALDCVPLEIIHAPVGFADSRDPGNGSSALKEFDLSPKGERWIEFPN